jgi:hypothetical protein
MRILAGAILVVCLSVLSSAQVQRHQRASVIGDGLWGGEHFRMTVSDNKASFELDCANGEIHGPLRLNKNGAFTVEGTLTKQGPGPIRIGREPRATPVRFTGRIKGNTMTIALMNLDTQKSEGSYVLTKGREVRLHRCY